MSRLRIVTAEDMAQWALAEMPDGTMTLSDPEDASRMAWRYPGPAHADKPVYAVSGLSLAGDHTPADKRTWQQNRRQLDMLAAAFAGALAASDSSASAPLPPGAGIHKNTPKTAQDEKRELAMETETRALPPAALF